MEPPDVNSDIAVAACEADCAHLTKVVRLFAERCLGTGAWEGHLPLLLEQLALAAGASAVRLYQHYDGEGGERRAGLRQAWPAGLGPERAESVAVPVNTGGIVWGALHFEGRAGPWSAAELDALTAIARILGAAIQAGQAAQALRWRESCLVSVAEASPVGVYLADARDGAVLYLNPRFRQIWRLEGPQRHHHELVARCRHRAKDPTALTAIFALESDLTTGTTLDTELELDDGRVVRCFSRQVRDLEGGYQGHLYVSQDVTNWRQAEEALRLAHNLLEARVQDRTAELAQANRALRESEELYRTAVETSPDCICLTDSELRVLMYNRRGMAVFGLGTPGDAVGMHLAEFVSGEDRDAFVENAYRKVREQGNIRNLEVELRRMDGTTFPAEVSASAIADGKGGARGVLATIRDITERRSAELALQASEKRFRAVFDEAPMGIAVVDRHGHVVESNYRLQHLLGHNADEFHLLDLHSLLNPTDLNSTRSCFEELVAGRRERYVVETRSTDGKGRPLWVRLAVSAIHTQPGGDFLGIATVQDITDQKALEDQIRQATKMEAVGRLAGGIAHDFNNLLTVIKGYSDLLLRDTRPDEQVHRRVTQIRKASERAASLVEQLLAFSSKQVVEPRIIHLNATVIDMEGMLRRLIGDHIDLITRTDPQAGCVEIDPGQLEQVIINLAVNARDAMPEGGVLTVTTSAASAPESPGVVVSVSDTGVGMTEEVRSHIFEPFFTTKEVGRGTGLGLSTVYGIVEQAGGRIKVTSEPGWGTAFEIWLPAVHDAEEVPAVPDGIPVALPGKGTILVCEDEEMVRSMICDTLREEGYRVIETCDGREAVRAAGEQDSPIDLLLTDMVMPRMGGREVSMALAATHSAARVLYMSGHTQGELGSGTYFLKKPFTPESLLEKVRAVLDASNN